MVPHAQIGARIRTSNRWYPTLPATKRVAYEAQGWKLSRPTRFWHMSNTTVFR